jgi:hypothetical protein
MSNQQNCPWCNANIIVTTYVCGSYFNDDGVLRQSADCREAEYIFKKVLAEREACAKLGSEPFGYFQYDIRLDAWVQNRTNNKGVAFYIKENT